MRAVVCSALIRGFLGLERGSVPRRGTTTQPLRRADACSGRAWGFNPRHWSLAIKELGRSVEHSGTELWLGFSGVVIQGGFGPEVGKTFGSYRGVP
jgi:hypothetical protein